MSYSDDPRLTAYVLGELTAEEREDLEIELAADESARRALAEVRQTIGWLRAGIQARTPIQLRPDQERLILSRAEGGTSWLSARTRWAAGLAAAAALVVVTLLGFWALMGPEPGRETASQTAVTKPVGGSAPPSDSSGTPGAAEKAQSEAKPRDVKKETSASERGPERASGRRNKSRRAAAGHEDPVQDYGKWLNEDVAYIASPEEKAVFLKLKSDTEREEFVEQFWYRRDPNPATVINEFKAEHYRRIAHANQRFGSVKTMPGWMTDRGRIYIIYGPPLQVESHPYGAYSAGLHTRRSRQTGLPPERANGKAGTAAPRMPPLLANGGTASSFPFEIWRYPELPGLGRNAELEFVDPSMNGEYRLSLDPEDKAAIFTVPRAGLTLAEELGMATPKGRTFFFTPGNRESQPISKPKYAGTPGKPEPFREQSAESNTEAYDRIDDNPFVSVKDHPLSTFSIDVDTASYSNIRSFLDGGALPPKDAVRIEEMVNYFRYDYRPPTGEAPFSVNMEAASAPWQPDHRLVRIGIKAREIDLGSRPPANLVFLIDVSGSMQDELKLPLLQSALRLLVDQLGRSDRVSIVVYAGASGLVLPSTPCNEKQRIAYAVDRLQAGGSTNGAAGIDLAYRVAREHFDPDAINRVILATDGDFNVGVTNQGDLIRMIEERARQGVFLTVLGFGMGNYKDSTLEKLADRGNGNYAYIDTFEEAKKVLVEELGGTLVTVAKDVKIQVEFNPAYVTAYRLIGYENRLLADQDFNDDKKDAGEIGAGLTVTALFELVPRGVPIQIPEVDPLKYQAPRQPTASMNPELLTAKLRYKQPDGDTSRLLQSAVVDRNTPFRSASDDFRFAAAVASFGMLLRDSPHKGNASFADVISTAERSIGPDPGGYRWDFVRLVRRAEVLHTGR